MARRPSFDSLLRRLAHATEHPDDALTDAAGDGASFDANAAAEAHVGRTLGPFTLDAVLGVGGMGFVFAATDSTLGRQVALKVLRPEVAERVTSAAEARLSAPLEHPNIARVYSAGIDRSTHWIAFERIPGQPLRHALHDGPLPAPAALRILADIARALAHAHARGLVHRDVKPENAIVRPDGHAVLLDFGIAALDSDTLDMSPGTPAYHPPWPIAAQPAAADLYALAVVAVETLTGTRPQPGLRPALPSIHNRPARRRLEALLDRALVPPPAPSPNSPPPVTAATLATAFENAAATPRRHFVFAVSAATTVIIAGAIIFAVARPASAPAEPPAPTLTPIAAPIDDVPITLAALAPDGSHVAFVDAHGLTTLDLVTRTRHTHPLPAGRSFRYASLHFDPEMPHAVSLRFPFRGGVGTPFPPTRFAPDAAPRPEAAPATLSRRAGLHLGWAMDIDAPSVGPSREALTPITELAGLRVRGAALSPSGRHAALVVSRHDAMEEARLVTIDLATRAHRTLLEATPLLLLLNDHVAVAWRGEDAVIAGLHDAASGGGNLWSFARDGDAAPVRLTGWKGTNFGHLGLGDDGVTAAFLTTVQHNRVFTAALEAGDSVAVPDTSLRFEIVATEHADAEKPSPDVALRRVRLRDATPATPGDADERPSGISDGGAAVWLTGVDIGTTRAVKLDVGSQVRRTVGGGVSSWPVVAGNATLYWRHGSDATWRLHGQRGGLDHAFEPSIAVEAPLTAGRPGPPGALVRCPALAPDHGCVVARKDGPGVRFDWLHPTVTAGGATAVLTPLLTFPDGAWHLATRWDVAADGSRLVAVFGETLLDVDLRDNVPQTTSRRLESADRCWPQYVAAGRLGMPDIVTMSCIARPEYRLVAVHPDGSVDTLATSDRRWFAHPQLSPDNTRLAWSERAFQTAVSIFSLP